MTGLAGAGASAATAKRRWNGLFHPSEEREELFLPADPTLPEPAQVLFPIEFRGDPPRKLSSLLAAPFSNFRVLRSSDDFLTSQLIKLTVSDQQEDDKLFHLRSELRANQWLCPGFSVPAIASRACLYLIECFSS